MAKVFCQRGPSQLLLATNSRLIFTNKKFTALLLEALPLAIFEREQEQGPSGV
jgi:hypothetical protein